MIVVDEEQLTKLKDLGFKEKYNEDTGKLRSYSIVGEISVDNVDNPYNLLAPKIWQAKLSRYADMNEVADTLYDMFSLGICKKVEKESDLLSKPEE